MQAYQYKDNNNVLVDNVHSYIVQCTCSYSKFERFREHKQMSLNRTTVILLQVLAKFLFTQLWCNCHKGPVP